MLSEKEVTERLQLGEIEIEYALSLDQPDDSLVRAVRVDPTQPDGEGTQRFEGAFFGNRLSLTLGPLVYSHTYRSKRGRKQYQKFAHVFDLRKSNNQIAVQPGESITVNTNESIKLSESIGALTFPRLSHATAGLVLSPSYIDPLWSGILVLEISNEGVRPFVLKIGEKIAATHFYEVESTDLTEHDRDAFARKSHHFGLSWRQLLTSNRDPFPFNRRAEGRFSRLVDLNIGDWIKSAWRQLVGYGVTLALISALLISGTRLVAQMESFSQLPDEIATANERIDTLEEQIVTASAQLPISGEMRLVIAGGTLSAVDQEALALPAGAEPGNVFVTLGPGNGDLSVAGSFATTTDGVEVEVRVDSVEAATADREITVGYIIVMR